MPVTMRYSGPLFDRGSEVMEEIVTAVARELGDVGKETVLFGLNHTLRNPTGAYESAITVYAGRGQSRVHDSMVIYGYWLEGIGSRNKTTRFKGYHNFRNATQQLDRMAVGIAERVIAEHLHKLGG